MFKIKDIQTMHSCFLKCIILLVETNNQNDLKNRNAQKRYDNYNKITKQKNKKGL